MAKNRVEIDKSQCKGCQVCIDACPKGCLAIGSEINELGYQYAQYKKETCIACGRCFYVCPEPGAITVIKGDEK